MGGFGRANGVLRRVNRRSRRLQALANVDIFANLGEGDRNEIAEALRYTPFGPNETVLRQDTEAHCLYMIVEGEVSVRVSVEGAPEREVARINTGTFFGEMSLMTGAPHSATIVTLTPILYYRLDKASFQAILQRRPELAEEIAAVLAKRRVELEAVKENLSEEAKQQRTTAAKRDLLDLIRDFFALDGA